MAAAVTFLGHGACAQTTRTWVGTSLIDPNGAWSTATGLATNGVPGNGDSVIINRSSPDSSNTYNYDYTGPAVTLSSLYFDQSAFSGEGSSVGTLSIAANALASNYEEIDNSSTGMGVISQSGGSNTLVGQSSAVSVQGGSYSLSGGTNSIAGRLSVATPYSGTATYTLSNTGSLSCAGTEAIGPAGNFTQQGGSNIAGVIDLGNLTDSNGFGEGIGNYTQSGGD